MWFLALIIYVALPAAFAWGWVAWLRTPHARNVSSRFCLLCHSLATASVLLAYGTLIYAHWVRPFPYGDSNLTTIARIGVLLPLLALVSAAKGLSKSDFPRPLGWLAPICALGALMLWIVLGITE